MRSIDYYRAVLLGVVLGMASLSLFYMVGVALDTKPQSEPEKPKSNFTAVDTYKDCDIIQWHYGPLAEYKYFLYCNNTRPVYEK